MLVMTSHPDQLPPNPEEIPPSESLSPRAEQTLRAVGYVIGAVGAIAVAYFGALIVRSIIGDGWCWWLFC